MIRIRRSEERGRGRREWLESYHTFSFADYQDPEQMGYHALRVINEDWVAGGAGFPLHPHRDMEILTFILSGRLRHRDDLGNEAIIETGQVQRMTAGTGIRHSEDNPSAGEQVHLLQIWILPERQGLEPGYEIKRFDASEGADVLRLIASPDGRDGSATIHQDALVFAGTLVAGGRFDYTPSPGRHLWLQLHQGSLKVNGTALSTGDGAAIEGESSLGLTSDAGAGFILFDLA